MPKINLGLVSAIARRDLRNYFSNPSGYVFITLFIFLSAVAAFWQDRFFLNNLANLDRLNEVFPLLLVMFVPALTMAVWAEERKQGTDELLLTLPATDLEIVLGKFTATMGIYAASVALSLSHVGVLFWLGSPDLGLLLGNYLGYLLLGVTLIAAGMLASLFTANMTIAFILGAGLCAGLVFLEPAVGSLSESLARLVAPLGVTYHFADFSRGVVSFSALFYFLSLTAFLIYLNVILIGRRHWPVEADGWSMRTHHLARAIALTVVVVSLNSLVGRTALRLDVTAERLHSLSDKTRHLVGELEEDRPVFIHAYVSQEMPEQYVQTRANLLGLLREIEAVAGGRVQVRISETEAFSPEARDAREKFGITPRQVANLGSARASFSSVFLGVAVTCGAEEQVIPFFDRGLPVEYELARSIRVVARTERKKIGVVNTAIKLFGGMDFQTMRSDPAWSVVEELKKQYEVVQITPNTAIADDLDGLVVALPSSLPQEELDHVAAFINNGGATMLLVDPLPVVNLGLAPSEKAGANRNPFQQGQPPPTPKGDITSFLANLGVRWDKGEVTWDVYNPHPDLAHLPPEVVFVGAGNGGPSAFDVDSRVSGGLQELVLLYPGTLAKAVDSDVDFRPIVSSGPVSGSFPYSQMVTRHFLFGAQLNQNLPHRPDEASYTFAAHVRRGAAADDDDESDEVSQEGSESDDALNLIVVADLDFISEQFFAIRRTAPGNLNFDNVSFFLNAIDVLVGDESFIDLRNRRVKHRTLTRVEAQTRKFVERRVAEEAEAQQEADLALTDAQGRLDAKIAEVRGRPDLDVKTKEIMARNLQEVESRRLEVLKANIESSKEDKTARSKETMEASIRRIQSGIRTYAILLPPIPVFMLGIVIFLRRRRRERESAEASRRFEANS